MTSGEQRVLGAWRALTPTLSRNRAFARTPVFRRAMRERGREPFSREREKVAGASRPDEGLREWFSRSIHFTARTQRPALTFAATSAGTHLAQTSSLVLRKCLAPSSPVAWLSLIQAKSLLTVAFAQERCLR